MNLLICMSIQNSQLICLQQRRGFCAVLSVPGRRRKRNDGYRAGGWSIEAHLCNRRIRILIRSVRSQLRGKRQHKRSCTADEHGEQQCGGKGYSMFLQAITPIKKHTRISSGVLIVLVLSGGFSASYPAAL